MILLGAWTIGASSDIDSQMDVWPVGSISHRHRLQVIPTGPSRITPTVQSTLKQGNLPLTFQETKPTGFPPKTSPWRWGVFFSTGFFQNAIAAPQR